MTTWYEATEGTVEAANLAMAEIAGDHMIEDYERDAKLRAIWMPVANALRDSEREDLAAHWPVEAALAETLGSDYVGQTSDTGRVVGWGEDHGGWREFRIHEAA